MSAMSDFFESKLVELIFRGTAYTFPTTLYVGLATTTPVDSDTGTQFQSGTGGTGVEVTGGSYARQAVTVSTSNWADTSAGNGTTSNVNAITFPTATANWGTITGVAILDAATNGNILFYGALTASKTVNSGDTFSFAASALSIQLDN